MPREVYAESPDKVFLRDYAEAPLKTGQLRLASEFAASKHGTELAFLKGYAGARGPWDGDLKVFKGGEGHAGPQPTVPGNMVVGRVSELGPAVSNFKLGERILCYGPFRQSHVLEAKEAVLGDGRVLARIPDSLDWRAAVCLDPGAYALAAVRDGNLRPGDVAAIFSLGAIGLMAVQWARRIGAERVIAVDPLESRRNLALKLGADLALDPRSCDAGLEIKKASRNRGADVAVEYSGSSQALQAALRGLAFGGTVVCGAFPPPFGAGLDLGAEAHMNRPKIVFTRAASDPNADHPRWTMERLWQSCWKAIAEGVLTGEGILDPVVALEQAPEAYAKMIQRPDSAVKLGVKF